VSSEVEYRAYVVELDGQFLWSEVFVASDDDAAFEHARQIVDGDDVELWTGARFIARLKSTRTPLCARAGNYNA
jgi:hypothetical protein